MATSGPRAAPNSRSSSSSSVSPSSLAAADATRSTGAWAGSSRREDCYGSSGYPPLEEADENSRSIPFASRPSRRGYHYVGLRPALLRAGHGPARRADRAAGDDLPSRLRLGAIGHVDA